MQDITKVTSVFKKQVVAQACKKKITDLDEAQAFDSSFQGWTPSSVGQMNLEMDRFISSMLPPEEADGEEEDDKKDVAKGKGKKQMWKTLRTHLKVMTRPRS